MNRAYKVSPRFLTSLISWLVIPASCVSPLLAQVNGPGPSPANLFDVVLNIPGDEAVVNARFETTLGGVPGQTTQLNASDGGTIDNRMYFLSGSEFNLSGGTLSRYFQAQLGSEVNISGGTVGSDSTADFGSQVNISGGTLGGFRARPRSDVTISGGTFGPAFQAEAPSDLKLIGGEFHLNGADFSGGAITLAGDDVFTGTLADGSSFIFSNFSDLLVGVSLTPADLPEVDLNPIVISDPAVGGPFGLRAGQTLTLQSGGILNRNFAVVDATLNVEGGVLGFTAEASNSLVNISSGEVDDGFDALAGSEVTISGGTVGEYFDAFSGSEVTISGGTVGENFDAFSGSDVTISGGTVGGRFKALSGSEVTISGGTFGRQFSALAGSDVELIGGEFRLNGDGFSGNEISLADDDVFSGTLADGSTFIFSGLDVLDNVTLTATVLPETQLSPIVVDAPVVSGPSGLRAGQTLTLQSSGTLRDNFAVVDATLNVEGGRAGSGKVVNSEVTISGGNVGSFDIHSGSEVNISGGFVDNFSVRSGSELTFSGGSGQNLSAYFGCLVTFSGGYVRSCFADSGSEVNISGGAVGEFFAYSGSEVNISGGTFGEPFSARSGSVVNIFGSEFFINGDELDTLVPGEAFSITARNVKLCGVLSNGQQISYYLNASESSREDYCSPSAWVTVTLVSPVILGDVNLDGVVDFLDINPFIAVLTAATFQAEADCDENGVVDFLDINHFIGILSGN